MCHETCQSQQSDRCTNPLHTKPVVLSGRHHGHGEMMGSLKKALTIKVKIIKGDAVGGRALVQPEVQVLLPPVRVPLQVRHRRICLLLTHAPRLIKLPLPDQLAHLQTCTLQYIIVD